MFPQRCNHVKKYFSPFTQPCNYGKKHFLRQMQRCNYVKKDFSSFTQPCISVETKIRSKVEANICSDKQELHARVS